MRALINMYIILIIKLFDSVLYVRTIILGSTEYSTASISRLIIINDIQSKSRTIIHNVKSPIRSY